MPQDEPGYVELSAAIGHVRKELARAIEAGRDSPVAFRAGPIVLDFEVAFTASAGADAGVKVWVVSFGAKGEVAHTTTNRLTVTLSPVDRDGHDKLIGSVADH
jgi:hypothetical protein